MLPLVSIPETIKQGMKGYRDIFPRQAGFEHVSRYITLLRQTGQVDFLKIVESL
jgi:hypothetical protein